MQREMAAMLAEPDVKARLAGAYMEGVGSTPDELRRWMLDERARWAPVIRRANLQAE